MTATAFRASVGHLADFVHRRGDLGSAQGPVVQALEGLRRQQAHQADQVGRYQREFLLRGQWKDADIVLEITGRADGLDLRGELPVVEEIKTYRGELTRVRERVGAVHDAQVRLYAALFANTGDHPQIGTRLLYIDADSGGVVRQPETWDRAALAAFFDETCRAYAEWLRRVAAWRRARDASLAELGFPHAGFRPGQRSLARAVWSAMAGRRPLLAEAPTGTGKTLAVLYGALRYLPRGQGARLMYLTARGPGRRSAREALRELERSGAVMRAVDLLARDKLCFLPGTPCTGVACPHARGYYARRRAAIADLLAGEGDDRASLVDADSTTAVARRHGVCPVALQGDAARWADVVIADMNHAYDPFARRRGLLDPEDGGAVLLVDEAHNLEDRAREMFSAALDGDSLYELQSALRAGGAAFAGRLEPVLRRLEALDAQTRSLDGLARALERLVAAAGAWLAEAPAGGLFSRVQTAHGGWLRWLLAWQEARQNGNGWRLLLDGAGTSRKAMLRCLAPAALLAREHGRSQGLVLFSATLPNDAHAARVLGLPTPNRSLRVPSPFPAGNSPVFLVSDVDLRHHVRARAVPVLSRMILELAAARPGHHLVFVPAFAFLDALAASVAQKLARVDRQAEVLVQRPAMDEAARTRWLGRLAAPDGRTRIAFAVSGGVFGEGIDLAGERLVGVVVAGLPMPAPDVERVAIRDYHGAEGFDIAFRMPAMTRLLQAAGRLVRTESDQGIICLVDRRLTMAAYRGLLRHEWIVSQMPATAVGAAARRFWESAESSRQPLVADG